MHPHKLDLVQYLYQGDVERKIVFIIWLVTYLREKSCYFKFHDVDISKFTNKDNLY